MKTSSFSLKVIGVALCSFVGAAHPASAGIFFETLSSNLGCFPQQELDNSAGSISASGTCGTDGVSKALADDTGATAQLGALASTSGTSAGSATAQFGTTAAFTPGQGIVPFTVTEEATGTFTGPSGAMGIGINIAGSSYALSVQNGATGVNVISNANSPAFAGDTLTETDKSLDPSAIDILISFTMPINTNAPLGACEDEVGGVIVLTGATNCVGFGGDVGAGVAANLGTLAMVDFLDPVALSFSVPKGIQVTVAGLSSPAAVPEPGSLMLLVSGLLGLWVLRRRGRPDDAIPRPSAT